MRRQILRGVTMLFAAALLMNVSYGNEFKQDVKKVESSIEKGSKNVEKVIKSGTKSVKAPFQKGKKSSKKVKK